MTTEMAMARSESFAAMKLVLMRCLGVGWDLSAGEHDRLRGMEPRGLAKMVVSELSGVPVGVSDDRMVLPSSYWGAVDFLETCLRLEVEPHGRHAWATALGDVGFQLAEARRQIETLKQTIEALQTS